MEEDKQTHEAKQSSSVDDGEPILKEDPETEKPTSVNAEASPKNNTGGWGWGFSVLSDLQKAAEDLTRNAAAVAEKAAKSIADMQEEDEENSESSDKAEEKTEEPDTEQGSDDESQKLKKLALGKLEDASEESLLSQGLKVFDDSVESFTSGAWLALGTALKGGTSLVQKLEDSVQQGSSPREAGSGAPSLLETGKALTAKGMQVLEFVGKETMDLLITETGLGNEKNRDQMIEEVTFDRCFYIYGGPEQLEELEALSSHYTLLFNRRKGKLSQDEKLLYDEKLKQIQQLFSFADEMSRSKAESDKGKKIDINTEGNDDEMKNLYNSSVSKAADMAAGFTNALAGLNINDMIQRTGGRLESLHSEGVHGLSEMCCFAVTHLLILGKSMTSHANKVQDEDAETLKIEWPEDPTEKAKLIRGKAELMAGYVEAVSNSFITG
ncbi:BAT2 domain protein [Hirschfeldia incana]|nr:BAT2 domain protein [Hirschfeldia incana]